jgi:probable metal-binding protein
MENITEIHAHEVLSFIDANAGGIETAAFSQKVREAFGDDARFYACSAAGMTSEELLAFLFRREKIAEIQGRLHVNRANLCQH